LAKHGTTDTAVISVSFGSDKARVASILKGVRRQIEQDLRSDYYFVELVNQEEQSIIPEDMRSRIRHIVLYGSDRCRDLFQKECLMNYGWRESLRRADYEYFIFVDADLYSDDPSWFRQIRKRMQNDTSRIVQGFRVATDSLDPRLRYSSLAARYVLGYETDLPLNPGMCWALHRSMLEAAGGLNPLCIGGGGDSALVAEFLNTPSCQYDPWIYRNRWFREIDRRLPFRARLDGVPVDVVHLHHGYLKERNYSPLHYAIDGMPPIHKLISLNHNGLLEWNDPNCAERNLLRLRPRMRSIDAVDQLFSEQGYGRFQRTTPAPPRFSAERPFFRNISSCRSKTIAGDVCGEHHTGGLNNVLGIFNPQKVFRDDYPFSWCHGVNRDNDTNFIPIFPDHESPALVLDGENQARYIIGVIAVQPNWQPRDLGGFSTLRLSVRASKEMCTDVTMQLVSMDENENDHDSVPVSLSAHGLQAGRVNRFAIALSIFGDHQRFRLRCVRLLKIIGYNCFRLELSRVYIE